MSSEFMRRLAVPPYELEPIRERLIWRVQKKGRFAEARSRVIPWGEEGGRNSGRGFSTPRRRFN